MLTPSVRTIFVAATLSLGVLTGCSSSNPYKANRKVLEAAVNQVDSGQNRKAVSLLEHMLADTTADASDFALQRFFAYYLLTSIHEDASVKNAFLMEAAGQASSFSLQGTGTGGMAPSRVGHLVAAAYNASFGRSAYHAATQSRDKQDGEVLLPVELAEIGALNAYAHMNLTLLSIYSQLDFQDRVEEILNGMADPLKFEDCDSLLDDTRTSAHMRPWIFLAAFDYLKTRNERLAYKFGIRARETASDSGGSFGEALRAAIATWITDESKYDFKSSAGEQFDPALEGCTTTGEPNIEFEGELKN